MTVDEELADAQRWLAVTSAHMPTAKLAKLPARPKASRRKEGSAFVEVAGMRTGQPASRLAPCWLVLYSCAA